MSIQVILKTKSEDTGYNNTIKTTVNRGKKIEAKIFSPNAFHLKEFQIEMHGLAFYRDSIEASLEFVRKSIEDRMKTFGADVNVSIEGK